MHGPSPAPRLARLLLAAAALFALLAAPAAWALDPDQPLRRYAQQVWGRENGLPSSSVQTMLQDRQGYLWLGTQDGLVRFDGVRFVAFHSRNTPAIGNDDVQAVVQDRDGAIWFSTLGGGAVRLADGRFEAWTAARGLASDTVRTLLVDREGALWIGSDHGVDRLLDGNVSHVPVAPVLGDDVVEALAEDRQGQIWVATQNGGVGVLRDGACLPAPLPAGLAPTHVRALVEDEDGVRWFATDGQGLLRVEGDTWSWLTRQDGLPSDDLIALLQDSDGNLWLGTRRSGLVRLGAQGPEVLSERDGLTQAHVTSLLEDREGNLWVGTFAGGLQRLQDARFVTYGPREGIPEDVVLSVAQDRLGYVWIGTMRGLYRMHGEEVVPFAGMEDLQDIAVTALFQDRTGALWVGSFGQGLRRFAEGTWTTWGRAEGLSAPYVFAVAEDTEGRTWVGTQKGLDLLVGDRLEPVALPPGLQGSTVRTLFLDQDGRLWIGSDGAGLYSWTPAGFEGPLQAPEVPPNRRKITAALQTRDGALWFGTEGGLLRWRDGALFAVTEADGLHDDRIWRVLEDDAGSLWMSSNEGVYRVDRASLEAFFAGHLPRVESLVFGRAEGMVSTECNGGYVGAGARTDDGRLWFPTTRGVAVVDPTSTQDSRPAPSVVIEAASADAEALGSLDQVALAPGTWRFAIEFTAPCFLAPDKVRYRYALDGQPWTGPDNSRSATFTNLDPGHYTFRVEASTDGLVWSAQPTTLRFTVLPRLWQTAWFRALATALGAALLFGGAWLRERRLRARQVELEAQVAARTRQLAQLAEERKELSLMDTLTGLRNRRFLLETVRPEVDAIARQAAGRPLGSRFERRPTSADRLGLCMVDIDHFKQVNDTWGHDAGDRVLEQLSGLLQDTARGQDVVVRWGGEEFLVVLRGADEEGLAAFGERLRRRVEARAFTLPDGSTLHRTCSIGLVCCPVYSDGEYGVDLEQLVTLADLGLYRAKNSGRNRCVAVRQGLRSPRSREEATRAFASEEAATEGGYLEIVEL
ncbi:MAG: two-component regulator propeller domain-containing protein [Pseudomonadota bacterium]